MGKYTHFTHGAKVQCQIADHRGRGNLHVHVRVFNQHEEGLGNTRIDETGPQDAHGSRQHARRTAGGEQGRSWVPISGRVMGPRQVGGSGSGGGGGGGGCG